MSKEKWSKILHALLFPGTIAIFLLVNLSAGLLFYVFTDYFRPEALAYFSYVLSAYTLTVVCIRMPKLIKKAKNRVHENKYANKYLTDKELRIRMNLYGGLGFNICFAIFKMVMAGIYQSKWLFAIAEYNIVLSSMRFLLVKQDQKKHTPEKEKEINELRSYKVCGWLMLLLNLAISIIVAIVVVDNQTIHYPGFMIYAIAAYTFYCLIAAIIDMVKYWHSYSLVFSAVKRIEMAKALRSVFTLQVAMLTQFGAGESFDSQLANAFTGGAVCVIVTVMAILMLKGVKRDRKHMEVSDGTKKEIF